MSLATGHKISRHNWTEIPMTDTAIARVEAIAFDEGQPLLQESGLVVEWRHNQDIDDFEYDKDYVLPTGDPVDIPFDADDYDPVDDDEATDLLADGLPGPQNEPLADAVAVPQGTVFEEGRSRRRSRNK